MAALDAQAVEPLPHIRDATRQVDAHTDMQRQHQSSSAAASRPSTFRAMASQTRRTR